MLVTNRYYGIVFSGLISGFLDLEGVFKATLESWILQYDFSDAIRYNLLQAEGMHMLFAVQSLDVQMNASSTSYNALCVNEYSGLLRTHTITVESLYNDETEMYENNEFQFSAYIDPDHTIATFVKPDGFAVSLDTVSCELVSLEASILTTNYQQKKNSHVSVLCNVSSPACCHNSVECEMKMNKCQSGFRLSENAECILCDQTSYCIGSEEFKCAKNSITLNRGSYQELD